MKNRKMERGVPAHVYSIAAWGAPARLLGWTYTVAWSLSFYPQVLLNYRRKSVTGLSFDFVAINPTGHFCLLIVNLALYFSSPVRREYQDRHEGHLPQVQINDVWFSTHATILSACTLAQTLCYKRDPSQRTSTFNRIFLAFVFVSSAALSVLAASPRIPEIEWLDLVAYLSYIKLYISFSKYVPQVRLNYQRKSTVGWSIENILLDLTGGTLSLAQLVLDSWRAQDWQGVTGNPGKLGLSILTLGFDLIFIVQHYILYRGSTSRPALGSSARPVAVDSRAQRSRSTSFEAERHLPRGGLEEENRSPGERTPLLGSS
ncbi:uncharacterized protein JCM15063_006154 [Sporobolomyces koalae]|uniref:uncharacterized protein n=1 Tax=Sporobolomyces koalae TaxID=500713 RepID=UPI00317CA644